MAYKRTTRRRASSSRGRTVRRRAPARRAPARSVRGRASRRSSVRGPQTIKIVIEHATQAGEGMAGMSLPQIAGQSKKAKF